MEKKSIKSKLDNFWYYYKYHTLFGVFVLVVIGIIIFSIASKGGEAKAVYVYGTIGAEEDGFKTLLRGFEEYAGYEKGDIALNAAADYPDEVTARQINRESLKEALNNGSVEGIFVYRDNEFDRNTVGNITNILPDDLKEKLGNSIVGYIVTDTETGETYITEEKAGIVLNNAKRFKEVFGEGDVDMVLQIPENCRQPETAIAFVRYLFDY